MMINLPSEWIPLIVNLVLVAWLVSSMHTRLKVLEKSSAEEKDERKKSFYEIKEAHALFTEKLDAFGLTQARSDEKLVQLMRVANNTLNGSLNGPSDPLPKKRAPRPRKI